MAKSKTKKKSRKSTKSSVPTKPIKEEIVLSQRCQKAVVLLKTMTQMELIQAAAPAIRDIGIYDIDTWSGGFNLLYTEIKNIIFDENLKLNKNLVSISIYKNSN